METQINKFIEMFKVKEGDMYMLKYPTHLDLYSITKQIREIAEEFKIKIILMPQDIEVKKLSEAGLCDLITMAEKALDEIKVKRAQDMVRTETERDHTYVEQSQA